MPPRQRKLRPSSLPPLRDAITRRLLRAIAPVLAPLVGGPITRAHTGAVARATLADVVKARASFVELAVQQYKSMTGTGRIDAPPLREYDAKAWEAALARAWDKPIANKEDLTEDDIAKAFVTADHQGREAERSQLIAYSVHDPKVLGWARVDWQPPTCPFCTMLISRGPVYSTEDTAGGRTNFHHGDTCSVVLVTALNRDDYPGIQHTRAAESAWVAASKGRSSADALQKLRDDYAKAHPRPGKTKQLADSLTEHDE